jgi:hypothetical protein
VRKARPERYKVDFPVFLTWQDRQGMVRRLTGKCTDLSAAGAHVETKDQLTPHSGVLMTSELFGRMGNVSVRYCRRMGMKYKVGLHFTVLLQLSDPVRKRILEEVLQKPVVSQQPLAGAQEPGECSL